MLILLLDPGSFGSVLSSLAQIEVMRADHEEKRPNEEPNQDIKMVLALYAANRFKPLAYTVLSIDMSYSNPDPIVTIKIQKDIDRVP